MIANDIKQLLCLICFSFGIVMCEETKQVVGAALGSALGLLK